MPHVVIVEEIHHSAFFVPISRLGWSKSSGLVLVYVEVAGDKHEKNGKEEETETEKSHCWLEATPGFIVHVSRSRLLFTKFLVCIVAQVGRHI